MKFVNKKASMMGWIVTGVVFLVVLILFIMFIDTVFQAGQDKGEVEICRKSIQTLSSINTFKEVGFEDIKCPMVNETIEVGEDDELKEELADEMAECYYKFGTGEWQLFETELGVTQYCVICSVIEFRGADKEIDGLISWMDQNYLPLYYLTDLTQDAQASQLTYLEYFRKYETTPGVVDHLTLESIDSVNTEEDYATIFLYAKKGYLSKIHTAALGGMVGGSVGGVVGGVTGAISGAFFGSNKDPDWETGILLWPYNTEDLNQLDCEKLPAGQV